MYEFKLPDVGEGIHEAEILRWLVKPGDALALNQPMLEIQTDKAVVEIPAPIAGIVQEIRLSEGTLAHVGQVLVVIAPASKSSEILKTSGVSSPLPTAKPAYGVAGPGQRVLAAPAVRKLALELGIDLTKVPGSGPAGRILPSDVRSFAENQKQTSEIFAQPSNLPTLQPSNPPPFHPSTPPPFRPSAPPTLPPSPTAEEIPLQGLRRRMVERMALAWHVPHVTAFDEVEVSQLVALRQQLQPEAERRGLKLTYLPFIVKAVTQALKEFPDFNASLDLAGSKIIRHREYHLGVATATNEGLLVPIIRHTDRLTLLHLAAELSRLANLAQQRQLSQAELTGSTFTVTNFGSLGMLQGTPIINPPEVAILGCGRLEEKALVEQGQVVARPVLPLALSFDHRLLDGAAAAAFLNRLRALLHNPNLLFLELT
jgi:pyruvate dehydrogenase E2 component (dihydrolipoamide acetyltransferase)